MYAVISCNTYLYLLTKYIRWMFNVGVHWSSVVYGSSVYCVTIVAFFNS